MSKRKSSSKPPFQVPRPTRCDLFAPPQQSPPLANRMPGSSPKKSGSSESQTDKATSAPSDDMTGVSNADPPAGEAGDSSAVAESGLGDGGENNDKDSDSHISDPEAPDSRKSKAVFAANESQNGPHTSSFAYELDGNLSRFNKPVVVNEAEFNLTDALYPISPIVGGPNGQTLSRNYSKALNSLIPTFESTEVRKQRERMRKWLLKETQLGNASYTVDTRLAIPGLSKESAKKLSESNGMTITAGDQRKVPLADQALDTGFTHGA